MITCKKCGCSFEVKVCPKCAKVRVDRFKINNPGRVNDIKATYRLKHPEKVKSSKHPVDFMQSRGFLL
jgi:hypothetical protein